MACNPNKSARYINGSGEIAFRAVDLKSLWQQKNISPSKLVFSSRESIGVRGLPIVAIRPKLEVSQTQELRPTER